MRIRSLAIAYMAGIASLALLSASVVLSQSWNRLADVREAEELIQVTRVTGRLVEAIAMEREARQLRVLAGERADAGEEGARTEQVFEASLNASKILPDRLRERFSASLLKARDGLRQGRADASPHAGEASFIAASQQGLADVDVATATIDRVIAERHGSLGLLLDVARLSNEIRDAAGQRSLLLTRYAMTQSPFATMDRVRVSETSGTIRTLWRRLERLSWQIGSPQIEAAVRVMRSEFFGRGEPIYLAMADAAREGTRPPLDASAWSAWTQATLATTLAPRDPTIVQAMDQVATLRDEAIGNFESALGGIAGVIVILLVAGFMAELGVLRPIEHLTEALDRLSEASHWRASAKSKVGELAALYGERSDEIGSLARAVGRFQRHAVDVEKLNHRFDAILANLPQGVCFYDSNDVLIVSNSRYCELYGIDRWAVRPGLPLKDLLDMRAKSGALSQEDGDRFISEAMATAKPGELAHQVVQLPNGRVISVHGMRVPSGGWLSTHLDITERTRAEAKIIHLANHDALTGLPNRSFFHRQMERALKQASRHGEFGIMCLDLDRFKSVNDTLGHACGDELLKQVALRLKTCVRDSDVVARLGGDEFAIIVDQSITNLSTLAQKIIESLSHPYDLDGHQAVVGTSVGIAIGPQDGTNSHELLKAADMALYRAKSDGRGTWRFFEAEMDARMQQRRLLELDLRKALPNNEFELHYQPILNLSSDEITGFEALIRWNHPERGRISPAEFIPLAEDTGMISEIGAWVLRQACAEAMTWPKAVKVAVNLSPRQFGSPKLLADVVAALRDSGLPASRLELEITEQIMLANTEATLKTLHDLRQLGLRISMDDFGTGYSSLSYLRRFPFDKIKIDQSFVRDLGCDPGSVSIVRAVAGLGAGLQISTTAEGVETSHQLDLLRAEGCTEIQGYFVSPPVPRAQVAELLARPMKTQAA